MLVKGQQKELNQEEEILNELLIKWQKVKNNICMKKTKWHMKITYNGGNVSSRRRGPKGYPHGLGHHAWRTLCEQKRPATEAH